MSEGGNDIPETGMATTTSPDGYLGAVPTTDIREPKGVLSPRESILFAMSAVQERTKEMLDDPELMKDIGFANMTEQERWDYLTSSRCKSNSVLVLDELERHHSNDFDSMFVVSGMKTRGFRDAPRNSEHSYFVVRDREGNYYAGTPANTFKGDQINFKTLLESDDLQGIIGQISERSGGNWPTTAQIESSLKQISPSVTTEGLSSEPVVEFTNIGYNYPDYSARRETYDYSDRLYPILSGFQTEE